MVQQVSETKSGNAREMNVSTQGLLGQNSDLMTSACSPLAKVHGWAPCQQELEDTLPHCKRSKYLLYDKSILLFPSIISISSVQFSSVAQSRPILWDPMDCSTPDLPVHHQFPEFTETHVHWVGDAIQPSHPLLSPSPPAFNISQHQSLFKWISSSYQVAKVLEFQLQHQSFHWIFRSIYLHVKWRITVLYMISLCNFCLLRWLIHRKSSLYIYISALTNTNILLALRWAKH